MNFDVSASVRVCVREIINFYLECCIIFYDDHFPQFGNIHPVKKMLSNFLLKVVWRGRPFYQSERSGQFVKVS